jgi:arylsulfatase A-like enzyme
MAHYFYNKLNLKTSVTLPLVFVPFNIILQAQASTKPNVIVIISDDQGYGDLSCYPHTTEISTPNIDKLAEQGVRFMQAYSNSPISGPSRAAYMTGRYPQRMGFYGNEDAFAGLPADTKLMSNYFKDAGYSTCLIGKWHLGEFDHNHPLNMGFDRFFGFLGGQHNYFAVNDGHSRMHGSHCQAFIYDQYEPMVRTEYLTTEFTNRAIDYINTQKDAQNPFYLQLNYNAPHGPLEAPEEYLSKRNNGLTKRDKVLAMIDVLDDDIGRLSDYLESTGLSENTVIVFASDNGGDPNVGHHNWILRGRKGWLTEGGIRVGFIMKAPGKIVPGTVYDKPVTLLDILPTVLTASEIGYDSNYFDGKNLIGYLNNNSLTPHETLYWGFKPASNRFAVRSGDWKLVRENIDSGVLYGLFNLKEDVEESNNLINNNVAKRNELLSLYQTWIAAMPQSLFESTGVTTGKDCTKAKIIIHSYNQNSLTISIDPMSTNLKKTNFILYDGFTNFYPNEIEEMQNGHYILFYDFNPDIDYSLMMDQEGYLIPVINFDVREKEYLRIGSPESVPQWTRNCNVSTAANHDHGLYDTNATQKSFQFVYGSGHFLETTAFNEIISLSFYLRKQSTSSARIAGDFIITVFDGTTIVTSDTIRHTYYKTNGFNSYETEPYHINVNRQASSSSGLYVRWDYLALNPTPSEVSNVIMDDIVFTYHANASTGNNPGGVLLTEVYPVFFDQFLIIQTNQESSDFTLYDIAGSVLKKGTVNGTKLSLETSSLKQGPYIIKVNNVSKLIVKK